MRPRNTFIIAKERIGERGRQTNRAGRAPSLARTPALRVDSGGAFFLSAARANPIHLAKIAHEQHGTDMIGRNEAARRCGGPSAPQQGKRPTIARQTEKGFAVNAKIALATAALAVAASCTLLGCSSDAEIPVAPSDSGADKASSDSYTLTDEDKLSALAVGETAVWKDYEVTVASIDRSGGQLVAHVQVKSHGRPLSLGTECLLSFGMPPTSSSFADNVIEVAAGETAEGTLLRRPIRIRAPVLERRGRRRHLGPHAAERADLARAARRRRAGGGRSRADRGQREQGRRSGRGSEAGHRALEAEIPSLFANNTFYTYQSVDSTTATVTPQEGGGYEYVNDVSILDGSGNPATTNVRLICEPNGNCISMTIDGIASVLEHGARPGSFAHATRHCGWKRTSTTRSHPHPLLPAMPFLPFRKSRPATSSERPHARAATPTAPSPQSHAAGPRNSNQSHTGPTPAAPHPTP